MWERRSAHISAPEHVNGGGTEGPDAAGTLGGSVKKKWVEMTLLHEAKGTVRAVEFAPHQFGLKLVRVMIDFPAFPDHSRNKNGVWSGIYILRQPSPPV